MKKIICIMLLIFGCATERPAGKTEAEVIYKEAMQYMKDGHYLAATERLNLIRSKYPYSFYATHAELLYADILYEQDNYVEAGAAYLLFRNIHPKHEKMNYVTFRIAESHYRQLPGSYDRDLTPAHEAIKYYNELLNSFGESKYTKEAQKKIDKCKQMLRRKERYIADFYYKTGVYDSARYRYLDILKSYDVELLKDHSMIRVVRASSNLEEYKACVDYGQEYLFQVTDKVRNTMEGLIKNCQTKLSTKKE
ncbi:MAG: outer membrane protein assembly factor BamD [Deltaproteobacteria bacterium]|nr:MAG: outer membrane protein assembly factor BamD [Deltaproteobacteria bacterium]